MKWITVSLAISPASFSSEMRRSARRTTVRATSSWAESWLPPGMTNFGGSSTSVHVAVDQPLELGDHRLGRAADAVFEPLGRLRRGRQLGAGDEDVVLEAEDVGGQLGLLGAAEGAGDAEQRAGLVEGAVGVGAAVVLGDAAAVPERGGPVVALLGVDLDHVYGAPG